MILPAIPITPSPWRQDGDRLTFRVRPDVAATQAFAEALDASKARLDAEAAALTERNAALVARNAVAGVEDQAAIDADAETLAADARRFSAGIDSATFSAVAWAACKVIVGCDNYESGIVIDAVRAPSTGPEWAAWFLSLNLPARIWGDLFRRVVGGVYDEGALGKS